MNATITFREGWLRCARQALAVSVVACPLVISAAAQQGYPQSPRNAGTPPRPQGSFPSYGGGGRNQFPGASRMPAQGFGGQTPSQRTAPGGAVMGPQPNGATRGEHLGQWMQQHGNLSPQQQQRALQREPGFNQLPQSTQQRMMDRLNRLNSMPDQQRQRVLQRGEAMERLDPQQRVQVRSAMGQLSALPEERRRAVARSFRELRSMPPAQRNQMLTSPEYHQQFSDEERGTLGNLLSVSPLLPPSR